MSSSPAGLRVCHLGKYYPPFSGGIETHVQILARAQAAMGACVQVFCINHLPGPTVKEMDGAVQVTRFKRVLRIGKLDICRGLVDALSRVEADILHMQVPNPTMIFALQFAKPALPIVVTYQSDALRQRFLNIVFRPVERLAYRRIARILATSPNYAAGSPFLKPYAERISVLPMGISLEPYLNPSSEVQREASRIRQVYKGPLWLSCGRLIYYKGLHVAIKALQMVPGTLLIVGDGPERQRLEAEAATLGVVDRIAFIGNLPYQQILPYYLAATAFWFPSNFRTEAFGLVQVEAMACGCPVINTAIPISGVSWVSRHAETGLTVPINDSAALATAANRLLAEPALRERLSINARQRAQTVFDQHVMARGSIEVYEEILGAKKRRLVPS